MALDMRWGSFKYQFRGTGAKGTLVPESLNNIDFQIPISGKMDGLKIFLQNHHFDDTANFYVFDKDGITGPPDTIKNQFAWDWNFDSTVEGQETVLIPYPAGTLQGLYLRIAYTSVGVTPVKYKINFFLHEKP
jgi:hypothetical protein